MGICIPDITGSCFRITINANTWIPIAIALGIVGIFFLGLSQGWWTIPSQRRR